MTSGRRFAPAAAALALLVCIPQTYGAESGDEPAIEAMLTDEPEGLGPRISDRPAWAEFAETRLGQAAFRQAERLVDKPIREISDDLYLDFSRTGNRIRWQRAAGERRGRLQPLVLGECIENKGRFLPAIV